MSELIVCRICLNTNVRMYHYKKYQLKTYYEEIMSNKINERDSLPHHFCYECATMLYKFHKFKEKCYNGQKLLKTMLSKSPVMLQSISEVDRKNANLQSLINIITVNHRVRTYLVKSQIKDKIQIATLKELEIASSTDGNDDNADNSLDYDSKDVEMENKDVVMETKGVEMETKDVEIEIKDVYSEEILGNNVDVQDNLVMESAKEDDKAETDDDLLLIDYKLSAKKEVKVKKKKKNKSTGNKKKKKDDTKAKRFEVTDKKKNDLNPNNWLKLNLSEEEAVVEFKARGQHKRYLSAKYKCTDCLRGFSKADMLTRHFKLRHHESAGPIECRFCRMRFKWKCYLSKHMRQHYTKYKCLRCDLICPLETTALFHEEYHNGVIRKCKHCGEEFKHLTTYYTHLRTHRSEHVCTLCGASFVSPLGLGIHKKIKHVSPENEVSQGEDQYCERCDIRFETRKAFEEHLIHSVKHDDGLDDLHVKVSTVAIPKKRRNNLKKHTKIPTDCHLCGKHFATQTACRKHHLAEHPRTSFFAPNERLICEICGISLAPGSVSSHLNIHTRQKLYNCNTCGRQFNSKGGMITHQLTHTSEKPVACTLCDKRFKQVSSMRLHYRTFHLKEPYPKRNRKKKIGDISSKLDDYEQEDSDENMPVDRWR